jgi:hypothetical protein
MRPEHASRRRVRAVVVAMSALLAACGGSTGQSAAPSGPGEPGASTTIGAQTTSPDGSVVPNGGTNKPGGTPGPGSPTPTVTSSGGGSIPPSTVDANVEVGQLAPFYLQAGRSSALVLELSAQDGAAPASGNVSHLQSVLRSVSGKSVSVDGPRRVDGGARSWTAQDLRNLADGAARTGQSKANGVIRLLFLHGDFNGDKQVLGISVRGDVAAIFSDQLADAADPLVGPAVLEDAVMEHEVGHLLGLVDLWLHTGRQDPQHPGHSTNKNSVMYWAVESSLVTDLLTGGPPRDFDAADLADLKTIRNG